MSPIRGNYIFSMTSNNIYRSEYKNYLEVHKHVHDKDGIIHVPMRYEITHKKDVIMQIEKYPLDYRGYCSFLLEYIVEFKQ